jgi:hypothetical protein
VSHPPRLPQQATPQTDAECVALAKRFWCGDAFFQGNFLARVRSLARCGRSWTQAFREAVNVMGASR